jgi:hypothetical protein
MTRFHFLKIGLHAWRGHALFVNARQKLFDFGIGERLGMRQRSAERKTKNEPGQFHFCK